MTSLTNHSLLLHFLQHNESFNRVVLKSFTVMCLDRCHLVANQPCALAFLGHSTHIRLSIWSETSPVQSHPVIMQLFVCLCVWKWPLGGWLPSNVWGLIMLKCLRCLKASAFLPIMAEEWETPWYTSGAKVPLCQDICGLTKMILRSDWWNNDLAASQECFWIHGPGQCCLPGVGPVWTVWL